MLIEIMTKAARRYLIGAEQEFVFKAANNIELPPVKKTDLYVHIPFCKNICPYCPYNKIKYDGKLNTPYLNALLFEIEQYYHRLGRIEVSSIYFGGGTPTNLINELGVIIRKLKERFVVTGNICVETNPEDINKEIVNKLRGYGVDLVSLGVQSFDDKYLKLLGRGYEASILYPAIDLVLSSDFKSVNMDLMFVLPGQNTENVKSDLEKAVNTGVNQITTYPLFTFPYSTVGKYLKLKKNKMPNIVTRRKMYNVIHDYLIERGFTRISVWGFKRGNVPRYSSVTRDHYIGLGAGAGSHLPGVFYFNTFSVEEYIKTCYSEKLPIAFKMNLTESLSAYYWLYWRFYDTYIPKGQLFQLFGRKNRRLNYLLYLLKILNLAKESEKEIILNEKGAFWLHLMQNYFSLNYINRVWSVAKENPFPDEISI